jgi:hypothetical protein
MADINTILASIGSSYKPLANTLDASKLGNIPTTKDEIEKLASGLSQDPIISFHSSTVPSAMQAGFNAAGGTPAASGAATGGGFDLTGLLGGLINTAGNVYASNQAAGAAQQAGQLAAQQAQFRPVGVTTRFGRSGFQYGPDGRLIGAGYQVAPDVAAMREALLGISGGALQQAQQQQAMQNQVNQAAQGLFGLGQQYVAESPQAAAQRFMAQQQELLAPSDERALAQLQNRLFRTGTGGLAMGATGETPMGAPGLRAANPAMEAFYNAQQQRNAQLAAQAQQAGQQQVTFGQGLLGGALNLQQAGYGAQQSALAPFSTGFGQAGAVEQQGLQALNTGAQLGGGNTAAAQATLAGQGTANQLVANRNTAVVGALADPVAQLIGKLFGG